MKISLFENSKKPVPLEEMTLTSFFKRVKSGYWKKHQDAVRRAKNEKQQKEIKVFQTPGVTLSGVFKRHRRGEPDTLSGFIGIDVDGLKDVETVRKQLIDDPFVCAVWASIRGNGLALLFKVGALDHAKTFNGIQEYLFKQYGISVDRQVRDIARLRYISYDPLCYFDLGKKKFRTKVSATPPPKNTKLDENINESDLQDLVKRIEKQQIDIVPGYQEWYAVGQALAALGERGRELFHRISKFGDYNKTECDRQFDSCLEHEESSDTGSRVGVGSVFFYAKEAGIKLSAPRIKVHKRRKFEEAHPGTVLLSSEGEKLAADLYLYHIWSFKVVFKKDEQAQVVCVGLSNEGLSDFLFNLGFRRSGRRYYRVVNNQVEIVTLDALADIVIQEGVKLPKDFSVMWDEGSNEVTRKTILNSVQQTGRRVIEREVILKEFNPETENFLVDTEDCCFLYFQNGVVEVHSNGHDLIPYENLDGYVWKASISPREYSETKKPSVIKQILENAIGKEYTKEIKSAIGYMIHTYVRRQGGEMLFCIDGSVGDINEGGNGKDFFGQVIGGVRRMVSIPGRSLNLHHQFAWEQVDRDTQVVWIEDLGKHIKMEQFYNLNNGIRVRRMHTEPFVVRAKIGASLQHLIAMEGTSDERRQVFLIFTDFYSKRKGIGAYHRNANILGDEWEGWDEYHAYIVDCVRVYLRHGLLQMDKSKLMELRKEELSEGSFENLEQGTWYTHEEALTNCWNVDTLSTEVWINFKRKLSQWCKLSGLELESKRRWVGGNQTNGGKLKKCIRIQAPMTVSGGKFSRRSNT